MESNLRKSHLLLIHILHRINSFRLHRRKLPLHSKISLYTGLRVEKNMQTLDSYRQGTTIPVNVMRDTVNFFPSANLSIILS